MAADAAPTAAERGLIVAALAKINLYLHVTGRRDDGYHLLDSLVAFADVADRLHVAPAAELSLTVTGPTGDAFAAEPDNIVLRAARALRDLTGIAEGDAVTLEKHLPVAAGIGGGSADAAAALRGLMGLWRVSPADDALARIALDLGADVPVCLAGRAAFVGGIGEDLAPAAALPAAGLVLVNPGVPLATPAVFAARAGTWSAAARFDDAPADAVAFAGLLASRGNDLEAAARSLAPAVGDVLDALAASAGCRLARMSGSGATCYGLYDDREAAARAAQRIAEARPGWWMAPARLVTDTACLATD